MPVFPQRWCPGRNAPSTSPQGAWGIGGPAGTDVTDDRLREARFRESGQEGAEVAVRDVFDGDGEWRHRYSYKNNVEKRNP